MKHYGRSPRPRRTNRKGSLGNRRNTNAGIGPYLRGDRSEAIQASVCRIAQDALTRPPKKPGYFARLVVLSVLQRR
jgi:hypothetical protein